MRFFCFPFLSSSVGKFGAVFASIPFPIFAALYCILFGLVGMPYNLNWDLIVIHFLLFIYLQLPSLVHQLQLEYHFFSSQTWTPWEILLSSGSHFSLEYLFLNFSINTGLFHDMALFILMLDGWVLLFPGHLYYALSNNVLLSCYMF